MNIQVAPKPRRKQNPAAVRQNIIDVAIREFSANGLAGSSVNVIAEKTDTSKRMIYYYFGGKSELYRAAIEHAYRKVLGRENDNVIDRLNPVQALEALVSLPFRNRENLDCFVRLVAGENLLAGEHLAQIEGFRELNEPARLLVQDIYERGVATGDFQPGLNSLIIRWFLDAIGTFNVFNRHTFKAAFGDELDGPEGQELLRKQMVKGLLAIVQR
jgi:AcrR family transcriptional regulator